MRQQVLVAYPFCLKKVWVLSRWGRFSPKNGRLRLKERKWKVTHMRNKRRLKLKSCSWEFHWIDFGRIKRRWSYNDTYYYYFFFLRKKKICTYFPCLYEVSATGKMIPKRIDIYIYIYIREYIWSTLIYFLAFFFTVCDIMARAGCDFHR